MRLIIVVVGVLLLVAFGQACTQHADCKPLTGGGGWCDGTAICVHGICHPVLDVPCSYVQRCDEATKTCHDVVCKKDRECDDGLFCNGHERCMDGKCRVGSDDCRRGICHETLKTCTWPVGIQKQQQRQHSLRLEEEEGVVVDASLTIRPRMNNETNATTPEPLFDFTNTTNILFISLIGVLFCCLAAVCCVIFLRDLTSG